jgi:hypothetical protein
MPRRKKRPIEEKHPVEMTSDEAMEWMFGKEVKDRLKEAAHKARKPDIYGKKLPHK